MQWYKINLLIAAFFISACQTTIDDSVVTAQPYIGLQERQDRTQLRELVGVDPVRTEWCAAFVNAILEKDNIPGSDTVSEYPLTARSFLEWGNRIDKTEIKRGDIVVFPRGNQGWQGHVGFYVETQVHNGIEYWVILGGNQQNQVRYDLYSPRKALGIRRWINTEVTEEG
jgi:uncharacterized protein (TIGR02594 family)